MTTNRKNHTKVWGFSRNTERENAPKDSQIRQVILVGKKEWMIDKERNFQEIKNLFKRNLKYVSDKKDEVLFKALPILFKSIFEIERYIKKTYQSKRDCDDKLINVLKKIEQNTRHLEKKIDKVQNNFNYYIKQNGGENGKNKLGKED